MTYFQSNAKNRATNKAIREAQTAAANQPNPSPIMYHKNDVVVGFARDAEWGTTKFTLGVVTQDTHQDASVANGIPIAELEPVDDDDGDVAHWKQTDGDALISASAIRWKMNPASYKIDTSVNPPLLYVAKIVENWFKGCPDKAKFGLPIDDPPIQLGADGKASGLLVEFRAPILRAAMNQEVAMATSGGSFDHAGAMKLIGELVRLYNTSDFNNIYAQVTQAAAGNNNDANNNGNQASVNQQAVKTQNDLRDRIRQKDKEIANLQAQLQLATSGNNGNNPRNDDACPTARLEPLLVAYRQGEIRSRTGGNLENLSTFLPRESSMADVESIDTSIRLAYLESKASYDKTRKRPSDSEKVTRDNHEIERLHRIVEPFVRVMAYTTAYAICQRDGLDGVDQSSMLTDSLNCTIAAIEQNFAVLSLRPEGRACANTVLNRSEVSDEVKVLRAETKAEQDQQNRDGLTQVLVSLAKSNSGTFRNNSNGHNGNGKGGKGKDGKPGGKDGKSGATGKGGATPG